MADMSNLGEDNALNGVLVAGTTYWMALNTAAGGTTNAASTTELTGGTYARQAITFGTASAGSVLSSGTYASQSFNSGSSSVAGGVYATIWTASVAGNYLWGSPSTVIPGPVPAGATLTFASGAIAGVIS